jgi:hypothetical protein
MREALAFVVRERLPLADCHPNDQQAAVVHAPPACEPFAVALPLCPRCGKGSDGRNLSSRGRAESPMWFAGGVRKLACPSVNKGTPKISR